MTAKCVLCFKPYRGAAICTSCERSFEKVIAEIPALSDELETTITRQTAMSTKNGSRSTETALAFNPTASTIAEELKATLVGWVRDLEPILDDQPANDIPSMGRWLLWKLPLIRQHLAVEQLVDEITYATRQAWKAVDRPKDRSKVFIADCLDESCAGGLTAMFPTAAYVEADPETHARIVCSGCEVLFTSIEWISVGKRLLARSEILRVRALEVAS